MAEDLEWRELLRLEPQDRKRALSQLDSEPASKLLDQALAHVDVLNAQGHRTTARRWLMLGAEAAGDRPDLHYRLERKRIRWMESEGLVEEAMLAMRALFERYRRSRSKTMRAAELCMELGILLDRQGHKQEALKLFRNAAERYQRLEHSYNRAAALFNTASVLYDLGRVGDSIRVCKKALQEGGSGHLELETHVTLQMANSHESKQELAAAREWYRFAAEGYRRLGNRKQESDILYRLGWMARRREQFEEAALFLERALKLKREYDYGLGLARYHLHQAESSRSVGLSSTARQHYTSCLGLSLALGEDGLATRARFGLYLLARQPDRLLPGYLRMTPEKDDRVEASIERGRSGVYSEQTGEGCRTAMWRQSGGTDFPMPDRTFLARLLEDLSIVWKTNATEGHEQLRRQGRDVMQWQTRSRRGNPR
ncbi:MAG: tetratricopeptide repeat protein [Candidatus Eremiobacterota bacterium]